MELSCSTQNKAIKRLIHAYQRQARERHVQTTLQGLFLPAKEENTQTHTEEKGVTKEIQRKKNSP